MQSFPSQGALCLAVEWLLGTLSGRATVHLTDKTYFTVTRLVDLLIGEPSYAAGTSLALDLHDEQSALTPYRVAQVGALLRTVSPSPEPLLGLTMLDSRTDPRIQLAGFLAGVARHLATAELRNHADPHLTSLSPPGTPTG